MPEPPFLSLGRVVKTFGGVAAVNELDMRVERGSVHGLIGPNGAGKTTLINLITGLSHPSSGAIRLAGADLSGLAPEKIAARGVARTYQNVRLFSGMTSLEQVMTGSWLRREASLLSSFLGLPVASRDWRRARERALHGLERVGMAARAHELSETLSYGEQRRVEIARALGSEPSLLLLDEPTAGMNAREADAIGRLAQELSAGGLTILMVEHNVGLVTTYCNRCTVMNFGRLLAEGEPKACLADPAVQEAYFGHKRHADRIEAVG